MKYVKHQQWRRSFPYYKVQYWDNKVNAWHDMQKSFSSVTLAKVYGIRLSTKCRVVEITREKRSIV